MSRGRACWTETADRSSAATAAAGRGAGRPARVSERLRVFLGAFGDPGHAFPMLALGTRLHARGHEVTLETWPRWRGHVEAEGMPFVAAPEYPVFPTREQPLKPYEAVVLATAETRVGGRALSPDVVVHDILTLAPAMAAELEGVPVATLIPHFHPFGAARLPALRARRAPTADGGRAGACGARSSDPCEAGLRQGRAELNATRSTARVTAGGPPARRDQRSAVPRRNVPAARVPTGGGRAEVHVVGPMVWEPPFGDVEPPPGDGPLVLIAPSTAQDPEHRLLRAALLGLGREPVRVLAATNRKPIADPVAVPHNAKLVEWISYCRAMPRSDLVITHAGPRHARAGARVRMRGAGGPALRRHGRERGADRLGRASASGCRGGCWARRRCGWRPGAP